MYQGMMVPWKAYIPLLCMDEVLVQQLMRDFSYDRLRSSLSLAAKGRDSVEMACMV